MNTMGIKNILFNNFTRHVILQFSILIIASFFLTGCGKKAPPVPPRQAAFSAVNSPSAWKNCQISTFPYFEHMKNSLPAILNCWKRHTVP